MKFQIEASAAATGAEERFFRICAFDLAEAGQRKMEEAAFSVQARVQEQMNVRAAVGFWENPKLTGERLQIDDLTLQCDAFHQIPADAVKGAFAYLLTIGETGVEEEGHIMTELYHDIWGTAYVESAMEILRRDCLAPLLGTEDLYLSENFGPGYFGMAMEESVRIFSLLDGEDIGITQKPGGLLIPEKSCMGLVLVYHGSDIKLPPACEKCLGGKGGCRFCDKRSIKELE